jgi:hypothetical protein
MRKTFAFLCTAFCLFVAVPQSKADTCGSIAGNLVANCGFETGSFSSWTLSGNDVPGEEGNLYGVEGVDPFDGISPNSGNSQAFIGDLVANSTTLQQMINTTATDMYAVTFYVAQDTAIGTQPTESNGLSASFGGISLVSQTGIPVEGYTKYSILVTATSSSSALTLTFGNDLGEFLVDDVSVVDLTPVAATPEPPAWTFMLVGIMGSVLLWKRDALRPARSNFRA